MERISTRFPEAPNTSFYANVIFCRDFHQTPLQTHYQTDTCMVYACREKIFRFFGKESRSNE